MQPVKKQFASRLKAVPKVGTNKYAKKAHRIAVGSYYKMLVDCAGICLFGTQAGGNMPIGEWINAATGWDLTLDEYLRIGERAEQLRNAFNIRERINPVKDFRPHPRVYGGLPLESGPLKKISLEIDAMSEAYCTVHGWNPTNGMPDKERLLNLGLTEIVETLHS
jgi:aldehyde:ferredoxin oxidoreductase